MRQIYVRFNSLQRFAPWFLTSCLFLAFNSVAPDFCALAATEKIDDESVRIDEVAIEGIIHTKPEVIIRLLPRPVPADFSRAEIEEFERRVRNLSLFDLVRVAHEGQVVQVEVHEKITLSPILAFTSGSDLKDLTATVGLVEYNVWGTATQLGGQFNYSQRGPTSRCGFRNIPSNPIGGPKRSRGPTRSMKSDFRTRIPNGLVTASGEIMNL